MKFHLNLYSLCCSIRFITVPIEPFGTRVSPKIVFRAPAFARLDLQKVYLQVLSIFIKGKNNGHLSLEPKNQTEE